MIGFDIGGTKCAVCIGTEENGVLKVTDRREIATDLRIAPYEMLDKLCALSEDMTEDFTRIGISCGGPLEAKAGVILSPPNLIGWDEVKIVDYLKDRYGGQVRLENDANACAVAEWKYGAGKGTENMIFLTFGTGMGAGLILNGQLYSGTCGMAGEVGHMRVCEYGPVGYGKMGSLEGFCSGGGIARLGALLATERFQRGERVSYCESIEKTGEITAKRIAECAKQGFKDAIRVYDICGEKLGYALAVMIDMLNPERIVIGSIYQRSGQLLQAAMAKVIEREALPLSRAVCEIVPAALKDEIGDYAALAVASL